MPGHQQHRLLTNYTVHYNVLSHYGKILCLDFNIGLNLQSRPILKFCFNILIRWAQKNLMVRNCGHEEAELIPAKLVLRSQGRYSSVIQNKRDRIIYAK
jgi:hypothetical protein